MDEPIACQRHTPLALSTSWTRCPVRASAVEPACGAEVVEIANALARERCRRRPPACSLLGNSPPCLTVVDGKCHAQAWEDLAECWTRCILHEGHDGPHNEGCMMWSNRDKRWEPDA